MRTYKTSWFNKAAKKARVTDHELSIAIAQVIKGQAVDLGGGVFKKRLNENRHRSILLSKSGTFWVFEFLFAKKDLDNIDDYELNKFKQLANVYAKLSEEQVRKLIQNRSLVEVFYEDKK